MNLEDPRLDDFELSDFNKVEDILKEMYGEKGVCFFDEIQNVEKWEKFIRYLIDKKEKVVMRDIAVRFGIKNTAILNKIAIYLISNVGKEFSYNSIKKMFSIKSIQSVIDYISFFENAYILFTVPRFSYSYK